MDIRIEPLDTLFFRDGKPFTMGEDTWADSHLLPSPSVIYGALRTAVATHEGIDFKDVEDKLNEDNFRIEHIYFYTNQNELPMPLDFVEYKDNSEQNEKDKLWKVNLLKLGKRTSIISKSKVPHIVCFLYPDKNNRSETLEDALISTVDLEEYLIGYLDEAKVRRLSKNYISNESKIGIGRENSTKTSDEGSLFRTDMKRYHYLQEIKEKQVEKILQIGVCLKTDLAFNSLVRLGGEGKIIKLKNAPEDFKIHTEDIEFEGGYFKVYLSTPAIFIDKLPNILKKMGINATLVTACVGKPLNIGGYDMKRNQPKPMYKAVPAGSVYYFHSEDTVSLLHKKLRENQGIALSDVYGEQGFGIAYFGAYQLEDK